MVRRLDAVVICSRNCYETVGFQRKPVPLPCRVDQTILFICTGNYYRSRFAEAFFNHHAEVRGLCWRAISRGLAIERVIEINKLSRFTFTAMLQRGILAGAQPRTLLLLDRSRPSPAK